jgi:hypothetical protein
MDIYEEMLGETRRQHWNKECRLKTVGMCEEVAVASDDGAGDRNHVWEAE